MANKLVKETPVHMSCPHCGKLQHPRLKWAKNHASLKCKHCGKTMDLREKHTHSLIERTLKVVMSFDKVVDALRSEAKEDSKAVKAKQATEKKDKKKKKQAKKSGKKGKGKGKKKAARRARVKPTVGIQPAPVAASGGEPPQA